MAVHDGGRRSGFRESVTGDNVAAQADLDLCVGIGGEGGSSGDHKAEFSSHQAGDFAEDKGVEEGGVVSPLHPPLLVQVCPTEEGSGKRTSLGNFLCYTFAYPIHDELEKKHNKLEFWTICIKHYLKFRIELFEQC